MDTSYSGVSFSEAQLNILRKDLDLIDSLTADLNKMYADRAQAQTNIDWADLNKNGAEKDYWITVRDAFDSSSIPNKKSQIEGAKGNYNVDLTAIQDQIKFQIQAQIANNQSATQAAQNQLTLQQNDPRLLLQKSEADAAQKLKAADLQATLDKQKRDQQVKVVGFIIVAAIVVSIGWYVIKKLL